MFAVSSVCPVQDYQTCEIYSGHTAEREQRETVAAVHRQVQKQAAEKAVCLPDNHCESMELCDMSKILQIFAEYTGGDKADTHATGFAVSG